MMDGHTAYCTEGPAYFSLGDRRSICLFDSNKSGFFDKYYVLGTLRSTGTFDTSVPYTLSTQAQVVQTLVEQAPRVAAEQRAKAECDYETTASMTNFRGGILMDVATRNNLYNLCMQAKGVTSH